MVSFVCFWQYFLWSFCNSSPQEGACFSRFGRAPDFCDSALLFVWQGFLCGEWEGGGKPLASFFRCRERELGIRHGRTPYFCICNSVLSCATLDVDVCMLLCRLPSSLCQCSFARWLCESMSHDVFQATLGLAEIILLAAGLGRKTNKCRGAEAQNTLYYVL